LGKEKEVNITYVNRQSKSLDSKGDEAQFELDKVIRYIWNQLVPESAKSLIPESKEDQPAAD